MVSRPPANRVAQMPTCSSIVSGRPSTVPFTIADSRSSESIPDALRSARNSPATSARSMKACWVFSVLIRTEASLARSMRSLSCSSRMTRERLAAVNGNAKSLMNSMRPFASTRLEQLPRGVAHGLLVAQQVRPGEVRVQQLAELGVDRRVLADRRQPDGDAAQRRLDRAERLRVVGDITQVVVRGDDEVALVGIGLDDRTLADSRAYFKTSHTRS